MLDNEDGGGDGNKGYKGGGNGSGGKKDFPDPANFAGPVVAPFSLASVGVTVLSLGGAVQVTLS